MDLNKCKQMAIESLGITAEIYDELIGDLLKDSVKTLDELQVALDGDDFTKIAGIGHSMGGYVANLRLEEIEKIVRNMESLSKGTKDKKEIGDNITALKSSLEEIKNSVG